MSPVNRGGQNRTLSGSGWTLLTIMCEHPMTCPGVCCRLTDVPKGDWFCGSCNKPATALAKTKAVVQKGGEKGEDELLARCQRLLTEVDTTTGGCILCRLQDFSKSFGDRTIILCDQVSARVWITEAVVERFAREGSFLDMEDRERR
jgi:hypothetical protein